MKLLSTYLLSRDESKRFRTKLERLALPGITFTISREGYLKAWIEGNRSRDTSRALLEQAERKVGL